MTLLFYMFMALVVAQTATGGTDPQSLRADAQAKAGAGKITEAIELYRRAAQLAPSDPNVLVELARLLARETKTRAEAEKLYSNAATLAPRDAGLTVERAANLVALGEGVNAILEYRRAFEIAPDDETAARGFVSQVVRLGATPIQITQLSEKLAAKPDDLASRLLLAELLRAEARYNDALNHYWLATRADANNSFALRGTAETWLALNYFRHAEEHFARAAGEPSGVQALTNRARVLTAAGQPEAAIRMLASPSARIERVPGALLALADAYREVGWLKQERATLERLLALDPKEKVSPLEKLIRVLYRINDAKALAKISQQLLAIDPNNAVGALATVKGKTIPAPLATPAQTMTPARRAGLDQEAAEAALFLGQTTAALPPLRRALTIWPDSLRLKIALGAALLRTDDGEGAVTAFTDVATYAGPRPDALLGLARGELLRRQPERARSAYDDVLRLDPMNFHALLGQAEAFRLAGDDERAAAILTDLSRRAPDSRSVNTRLRERLLSIGRSYETKPEFALVQVGNPASVPLAIEPLLGEGDTVRVKIAGQPRLAVEVSVDENGLIRLPFLDEAITARCLSERELGDKIIKRGGVRLANSPIEVNITAYKRAPLVVAGAVYLPGGFNVRTALDLRASLMIASGTTPRAGRSIYVMRGACKPLKLQSRVAGMGDIEVYGRRAAAEGRIKLARPLRAGDAVIVPEVDDVFITGVVAQPNVLKRGGGLTLQQAIERSGGMLKNSDRDRVRVWRLLPDGASYREHQVNLSDIEGGRVGDVVLESGDIVDVPAAGNKGTNSFAVLLRHIMRHPPPPATFGGGRLTAADKP
ncbi:MAG: tetratricopeptide repeat protein [Pyrinomonadaceae bacterium]|nr:tetratricopeptide repeat protein [Pyrinomonadaceae bacterium]